MCFKCVLGVHCYCGVRHCVGAFYARAYACMCVRVHACAYNVWMYVYVSIWFRFVYQSHVHRHTHQTNTTALSLYNGVCVCVCVCVCVLCIGVRDEFRSGGLQSLLPEYVFHCLHENQMVLPKYYLIFPPENGYLNNHSRGAATPSAPWAVRLWCCVLVSTCISLCVSMYVILNDISWIVG